MDITTPIGELMMGLAALLAQFEVRRTAQRTTAGIRAIQERGLRYGAQPKLSDAKAKQLVKMRKGGASRTETARKFKVSTGTVRNYELRAKGRKR